MAKGALEGLVASATAAGADLFAVEVLVGGGGEDFGLAVGVDALGLLAGLVAEDTSGGRSGVGGGVRGGVGSAAATAAVVEETTTATAGVEETTATAAPLSGFLGLFFKVGGFGETAVTAGVEGAVVDTEGVDDARTAGVAAAVGGGFVSAVVAGSTGGGSTGGTVTSYTSVGRAGCHEGETEQELVHSWGAAAKVGERPKKPGGGVNAVVDSVDCQRKIG